MVAALLRLALVLVAFACASDAYAQDVSPTVVYLVRHAERAEDGTDDPPISAAGEERARILAEMLRDAELTHLHTTNLIRTRATIAPLVQATGLEPEVYDADDLVSLAAEIRATPGRHLIVGHSNTTTEVVEALGGDAGSEIAQDEYDRLYILTIGGGPTATTLLRFGARYRGPT